VRRPISSLTGWSAASTRGARVNKTAKESGRAIFNQAPIRIAFA